MKIASIMTGFAEINNRISFNIYVQGCNLRCDGCHNPELWDFGGGKELSIETVEDILKRRSIVDSICWLGGDATYQPSEFMLFNKRFKELGFMVCLYTGRLLDDVKSLLENVDIVIDGPWLGKGINEEGTNQKVYIKTGDGWKETKFNDIKV